MSEPHRDNFSICVGILVLTFLALILIPTTFRSDTTFAQDAYPPPAASPVPFNQPLIFSKIHLPLIKNGWNYLHNIPDTSYSYSKYITNFGTNNSNLYNAGCELGQKANSTAGTQEYFVFLGFGQAYEFSDGTVGAQLLESYEIKTASQIKSAIVEYSRGFWTCSGSDLESTVSIGVGINSSSPYYTIAEHGYGWAELIQEVSTLIYGQSGVVGAGNFELGMNLAYNTSAWVNGYKDYVVENNLSAQFPLYVIGDAAGCPTLSSNTICGTEDYPDWNTWYVWYINYGNGVAFPVPEIYHDWYQAEQWLLLSLYYPNDPMIIIGEITQQGACLQKPNDPSCINGGDNSPDDGYGQLYTILHSNLTTRSLLDALIYSTDISYKP